MNGIVQQGLGWLLLLPSVSRDCPMLLLVWQFSVVTGVQSPLKGTWLF